MNSTGQGLRGKPGRERLDDLDRRLRAAEQHVLTGLDSEEDREVFRALLRRLATHADALDPVRGTCEVVPDAGGPCGPSPGAN